MTFDDIRRLALALPEVEEGTFARTSTSFKIRGKYGFARFGAPISGLDPDDADDTLMIRIPQEQRNASALERRPSDSSSRPTTRPAAASSLACGRCKRSDLEEIEDLLADAWRRFAPKRLLAEFDRTHV